MYNEDFLYKENLNEKEYEIVEYISCLIEDNDTFDELVNDDMTFVFDGELPENKLLFEKHWIFHLIECLDDSNINDDEFHELSVSIDFDNKEWSDDEKAKALFILDMLRISMIAKAPMSMEFFKNPSFDVLMFANKMDFTDDKKA